MSIIVKTKEELEKAMDNKEQNIVVQGELAEKLYKTRKIAKLSGWTLVAIAAALAAAPFTGGLSAASLTAVAGFTSITSAATLTGLEIGVIVMAATIGLSIILALYKNYDVKIKRTEVDGTVTELEFARK